MAIPAAAITVLGTGFGRAKGGKLGGGACKEISELVSGVSGEAADGNVAWVFCVGISDGHDHARS